MAERQTLLTRDTGQGIQFAPQRINAPQQAFGDGSGLQDFGRGLQNLGSSFAQIGDRNDQRDAESISQGIQNAKNKLDADVARMTEQYSRGYTDDAGVDHAPLHGAELQAAADKLRTDKVAEFNSAIEPYRKQNPRIFSKLFTEEHRKGAAQEVHLRQLGVISDANARFKVETDQTNAITNRLNEQGQWMALPPAERMAVVEAANARFNSSALYDPKFKQSMALHNNGYLYQSLYADASRRDGSAVKVAGEAGKKGYLNPAQVLEVEQAYVTATKVHVDPVAARNDYENTLGVFNTPGKANPLSDGSTAQSIAATGQHFSTTIAPERHLQEITVPLLRAAMANAIKTTIVPAQNYGEMASLISTAANPNDPEWNKLTQTHIASAIDSLVKTYGPKSATQFPALVQSLRRLNELGGDFPKEVYEDFRKDLTAELIRQKSLIDNGAANQVFANDPVVQTFKSQREAAKAAGDKNSAAYLARQASNRMQSLQEAFGVPAEKRNTILPSDLEPLIQALDSTDSQALNKAVSTAQEIVTDYGMASTSSIINLAGYSKNPGAFVLRVVAQTPLAPDDITQRGLVEATSVLASAAQWANSPDGKQVVEGDPAAKRHFDRVAALALNMPSFTSGSPFGTSLSGSGTLWAQDKNPAGGEADPQLSPLMRAFQGEGLNGKAFESYKQVMAYMLYGRPGPAKDVYQAALETNAVFARAFLPVKTSGGFNPNPTYTIAAPMNGEDSFFHKKYGNHDVRSLGMASRLWSATVDAIILGQHQPKGSMFFNINLASDQILHSIARNPFGTTGFSYAPNVDTFLFPTHREGAQPDYFAKPRIAGDHAFYPQVTNKNIQFDFLPSSMRVAPENLFIVGSDGKPVFLHENNEQVLAGLPPEARAAVKDYLFKADPTDKRSHAQQVLVQGYQVVLDHNTGDLLIHLRSGTSGATVAGTLKHLVPSAQIYQRMPDGSSRPWKWSYADFDKMMVSLSNSATVTGVADSMPDTSRDWNAEELRKKHVQDKLKEALNK